MTAKSITLELPEDLIASLDSSDLDDITERAWKALVLDLLRDAQISQGRAARLLGVTRFDILDLMALHHIESGPRTAEEVDQEIEAALRYLRITSTDGGG